MGTGQTDNDRSLSDLNLCTIKNKSLDKCFIARGIIHATILSFLKIMFVQYCLPPSIYPGFVCLVCYFISQSTARVK